MDEQKEEQRIKCNRCKVKLLSSNFSEKRDGILLKTCNKCRTKNNCEHGRQRSMCKECGGSYICCHNRQRSMCKECGGSSFCVHDRRRNQCKECGGGSICCHSRQRYQCKECGGSSFCCHSRQRNQCKDCGGASFCFHNRRRSSCKECMTLPEQKTFIIKNMVSHSRRSDKEKNRYDADNFIDKCFLEGLFEDNTSCHYCKTEFTYNEYVKTLVTIERLNNNIGHIKSNCVLACLFCNFSHNNKEDIRTL